MSKKASKTIDEKTRKKDVENKEEHGKAHSVKKEPNDLKESEDISAEEIVTELEEAAQSSDKQQQLEQKIEELTQKLNEVQDKYIRLSAEFDNYRKRTLKEKTELIRSANEDLLKDILPVVDDFERGLDIIDKSQDLEAMRTGIHLIYNKFSEFLKQEGLKEIEARNLDFNLDLHEAITKIPAPVDEMKGKVVDVILKGYTLNEKVIRYAKVVVGE